MHHSRVGHVFAKKVRTVKRHHERVFSGTQGVAEHEKVAGSIHRRGDLPYGSREYLLLPPHLPLQQASAQNTLANLRAHRNIVFGAQFRIDLAAPLLRVALEDCSTEGEQPQAVSTLHGLSQWVCDCLDGKQESDTLPTLDAINLEAITAIATGIPREGHFVVGQGTFRNGAQGWKALAREFLELGLSEEANLYRRADAQLVAIEHLADTNTKYLKSAGGAMARLVFT